MKAKYLRFGYKRHGPMRLLAGGTLLFLLALAGPAMAAKPDKCDKNPDHADCVTFNIMFGGTDTLVQEYDFVNGVPWQKGYGVGEQTIPLYGDRIAAIGDHYQPCSIVDPGSCAARLSGESLVMHGLSFRTALLEDGPDMMFNFYVYKELVDYRYTVDVLAWADMAQWDTSSEYFCVPMQFYGAWIRQSEPTVKRRTKQCRGEENFEVCEADDSEGQSDYFSNFWGVIWRDDNPFYDAGTPLVPPC